MHTLDELCDVFKLGRANLSHENWSEFMSLPSLLTQRLRLPVIAAPMFLASGPELVIECCKAGVVGTFPALNQRSSQGLEQWLTEVQAALAEFGADAAPYGVNLIVHKSNPRLEEDLALCIKHQVPLIITSLGANAELIEAVHGYGGLVFHDVINVRHAKKAAAAGVDGLIAVAAGAGGHAGTCSPFALINEIRQFFDKTLLLSGCLSTGSDVAAAQMMGADLAYMGTRFLSTEESRVASAYKSQVNQANAADIIYTAAISGVNANFIRQSIEAAGLDIEQLEIPQEIDFGAELGHAQDAQSTDAKPWKDIWSAGQGVGSIDETLQVVELVDKLVGEYQQAWGRQGALQGQLRRG